MLNSTHEEKESQATECLRIASAERGLLLALAVKLTGSQEGGHDLYTETVLDCHDAIQRLGFDGKNYKFYIYQAIKLNYFEAQKKLQKFKDLPDMAGLQFGEQDEHEVYVPTAARRLAQARDHYATEQGPEADPVACLAAQIELTLTQEFTAPQVVAFRLHVAGMPYRKISQHTGHEFSWIRRSVEKMKEILRHRYSSAHFTPADE